MTTEKSHQEENLWSTLARKEKSNKATRPHRRDSQKKVTRADR